MTHNYRRVCIHCGDPTGCEFATCGRCAQLLEGLDDVTVEPPSTGLAIRPSEESRNVGLRDGRWLAWAAAKRNCVRWFHDYGHQCGFPRDIRQWSPIMVERAVQARIAEDQSAAKTSAH